PESLMEELVDVDWFMLESQRSRNRQNFFDERGYSRDAIKDKAAVLSCARVARKHRGHQFGCSFDSGQRVFDFMSKAGRGQSQCVRVGPNSTFQAQLMGQILQQDDAPFGSTLRVHQR